jgi:hypothetical protein
MTYELRAGTSICERALRTSSRRMASGRFGMNGTSRSSTLDGRWVETSVFTSPKRLASGTAARYEPAEQTPVQKKMVPAVATERSKRWNSHSARSDWTTKPPPKESRLKRAANVYTMRRDSRSGACAWRVSSSRGDSRL